MKHWYLSCALLLIAITGCNHSPSALSAEGKEVKSGQTVFAVHGAIACFSSDYIQHAVTLRAQKEGTQLRQMFEDKQCGFFSDNERLKVVRIEPQTGYQAIVGSDLDDSNAPPQIWVRSDQLSVRD
jgi:hypothetical protein